MHDSKKSPKKRGAFTLIEIMVALMILTTLFSIAVPQFLRAREVSRARGCVKNLKVIEMAKEQYGMDNHLSAGATLPALSALCGNGTTTYIKGPGPICESGGTYTVGVLSADPTCSIGTSIGAAPLSHTLP
ncbi:competence type IV pilus major pilin ComGC [Armatimonas rosea]|uniref:Prepilin-type N-terminal cleavage/methylation domain-containing protein n=1 Tax=Armatimonas rosea TaxID=685828 RepID=A0A7W9W931_ARMRO|nr:prepilin-type N-terminal cleavage/methylation domain-containing protein [Armatimonas rosea]MBB6052861.1 prepilin-type N-terminal cleavage/methylation domain-containing protein [Armatimonas rosea]